MQHQQRAALGTGSQDCRASEGRAYGEELACDWFNGETNSWRPRDRESLAGDSNGRGKSVAGADPRTATWQNAVDQRSEFEGMPGEALRFLFALPGEPSRVLVGPLAETSAQTSGQTDAGLSELVPQLVGSCQRVFPALLPVPSEQVDLRILDGKGGRMHTQQADLSSLFPVLAK